MKGFIVSPTYRVRDGNAFVYLFGRLENGESFLTMNEFKPYFFIKQKDAKKASKLGEGFAFDIAASDLKNFEDEKVSIVTMDNPQNVPGLRDKWHEEEINSYEADIRFVNRYLIDNGIKGSMEIKGEYEPGDKHDIKVDRVYMNSKLTPVTWTPELKILSIDIESNKDSNDLWAIGLYTDGFKKCLIKKQGKFKDAETFDNEKDMLERFKELVIELDPDIITGWNVIDFDLDFLEKKFKDNRIKFVLGRTDDACKLRRYESFFRDSTANITGRQVLDGIHLLRISFVRLDNNKLDTAAKAFLGDEKLIEGSNKYELIREAYEKKPQKLIDYNIKDAKLALEVIRKSGVLDLTIQRSLVTGMQPDRVKASVASLDNLYLAELRKRGYVASSRSHQDRDRRITGGFVMPSKPGVFDYVIVCDFKSLYPSIMRTFNIDPWAYQPNGKGDLIEAPNGAKFKREEGIIPGLLKELWQERTAAKKAGNDLKANAVKVLMNSMFGVLANPTCRFYSFDMANAITHFGQHFIKLAAEKVKEKGYEVIYGDTDSIFIDLSVESEAEANKIGNEIQDSITAFFKQHIKKKYKLDSYLELEFEKVYKRFLMPKVRAGDTGAKKRYAGLKIKDGKEEMEFVGLEFVRRDWTDLAKRFQLGVLDKIFHKDDPSTFIKKFVKDLKKGKHDKFLVYRKALRKDVDDYTKTTPPHVKAARQLKELDGNVIEYLMTTSGPEPLAKLKHAIDYEHYIEKQLKPIADSVLTFYDTSFEDVLAGTKQMSLGGF
ncbi:DNA polymerase II [Nanoarchaeota archaeon]